MNSISIQNLYPKYFTPKNEHEVSSIWNKKITFEKGDSYLIIAPSGSGKSTLASALLGNHFQYEGNVFYDDKDLKKMSLEQIVAQRRNGIQLLFQDVRLIPELTLKENIFLRVFNIKNQPFLSFLEQYSKRLGIFELLDKKAMNCSYGERQRAAIVRSLIHPSDFLLFDECFSHLDQDNKRQAFQLIHEVANEFQKAVLFFELNDFPFEHNYKILHL